MDKQALRERIWDDLETAGVARFPFPPHDRIPNFAGAEEAAVSLTETPEWQEATVVKANPDAPQLPVRRAALRAGKTLYMAVPRLRDADCFLELDPADVDDLEAAPTISHVDEYARPVAPADVPGVDLIVAGSVAVTEAGDRIGKGEGYSDLEYGLLAEVGRVSETTTVATTVHERQVVDADFETATYDVPLDIVVTPERRIRTDRPADRPAGIDWDRLSADRIEAIPALASLRAQSNGENGF